MFYYIICAAMLLIGGILLQSKYFCVQDGPGALSFLGLGWRQTARTLCLLGVVGFFILFLGVEIFLVLVTIFSCVLAFGYRLAAPKALNNVLQSDSFWGDIVGFCHEYATFLLVLFVIRSFVFQHYRVPTGSLEPTVRPGDFLLVNQFSYGWHIPIINTKILDYGEPKRGEIALFRYPKDPYRYIYVKRVVGLPGDHLVYRGKQLTINGALVQQKYLGAEAELGSGQREFLSKRKEFLPGRTHDILVRSSMRYDPFEIDIIVPKGSYFMMGDNRDMSLDSRYFGPVEEKYLLGRVICILLSWNGWLPDWKRIGMVI